MKKDKHTMNEKRVFRVGPIRPPSEADSLLLQITNGCTWNKCRFCSLYRHTEFRAYSEDSIKADIDAMVSVAGDVRRHRSEAGWDIDGLNDEMQSLGSEEERSCYYMMACWLMAGGRNVFLQDGNSTVLSRGRLTEVLRYLRQAFPGIRRVTSYGRAENLYRVGVDELRELKEAGLDRIHSGYESGSDQVLRMINKGVTSEQQIEAGRRIREAGIELSVYFMPGIGGSALSEENGAGMSEVVNRVEPDYLRIRTAAVKPGTELYEDYRSGRFSIAGEDQKVREIRRIVEDAGDTDTVLVSDHIVNLLQTVEGHIRRGTGEEGGERRRMLDTIDGYLELPKDEKRIYQLARRLGRAASPGDVASLSRQERREMALYAGFIRDDDKWEEKMNSIISRYI